MAISVHVFKPEVWLCIKLILAAKSKKKCNIISVEAVDLHIEQDYGGLTVEVVNISSSYLSEFDYDIHLTCYNDSNSTSCYTENHVREQTYYFNVKDCEQIHHVQLYWTPAGYSFECLFYNETVTTPCSQYIYIYLSVGGSLIFAIMLICITIIIILYLRRR